MCKILKLIRKFKVRINIDSFNINKPMFLKTLFQNKQNPVQFYDCCQVMRKADMENCIIIFHYCYYNYE